MDGILGTAIYGILGSVWNIRQLMRKRALYGILGDVWDIGQCMGCWEMYVILGNGGVIWDVGQYIGYLAIYAYWVKYALLGNVYFISNVWYTGRYMIYIFGNS